VRTEFASEQVWLLADEERYAHCCDLTLVSS